VVELVEYFATTLFPRLFHYILFGSIFILFGIVDLDFGFWILIIEAWSQLVEGHFRPDNKGLAGVATRYISLSIISVLKAIKIGIESLNGWACVLMSLPFMLLYHPGFATPPSPLMFVLLNA
jgi:hypothetical protein